MPSTGSCTIQRKPRAPTPFARRCSTTADDSDAAADAPSLPARKRESVRRQTAAPTELFSNENNNGPYWYAREFECDRDLGLQTLVLAGIGQVNLSVTGVPDGVPPQANLALVPAGAVRRLHYFADQPLDEESLATLDGYYGRMPYRRVEAARESAIYRLSPGEYPRCNFYACYDPPASNSRFVEYRYLQDRYTPSQVALDVNGGDVYRLGPLPDAVPLVLVMPANFVKTAPRNGYFHFAELNLMVRVYSQHTLTSATSGPDPGTVSDVSGRVGSLRPLLEAFFSRLGLHRISLADDQICASDRMLMLAVGSVANVTLPPTERMPAPSPMLMA